MTTLCEKVRPLLHTHPLFLLCGLSRHSREKEPFLFTLPVSVSCVKSVPAGHAPVRGAQLSVPSGGARALELRASHMLLSSPFSLES